MEVKIEKIHNNLSFALLYFLFMFALLCSYAANKAFVNIIFIIICAIRCIYYFLRYINEKLTIYDNRINYSNLFGNQVEMSLEDVSIRKVKKHFQRDTTSKSMYFREYVLAEEYILFIKNKKIFKFFEEDLDKSDIKDINLLIQQNKLKMKKENIDGEDVNLLKVNPTLLLVNLFLFAFFGLLITVIYIGLFSSFNVGIFVCNLIFTGIDIFYLICLKKEFIQVFQKVYYIENQGFYKNLFGKKEYFEFKDIDECITKKYKCIKPVENELRLYKENKRILTLTNSTIGFYNFLDEVIKIKR